MGFVHALVIEEDMLDVIARHRGGELAASSTLGRSIAAACERAVAGFRLDYADAADAMGAAMLRVVENLEKFHGRSAFSTWVHRVAATTTLSMIRERRKSKKIGELHVDEADPIEKLMSDLDDAETLMSERAIVIAVRAALARLDANMVEVATRHIDGGERFVDIAESMKLGHETVRTRMFRVRRAVEADPDVRAAVGIDDK